VRNLKLSICFILVLFLSACDGAVKNFVESAIPTKKNKEPVQSSSPIGIKVSPGRLEATSADISAEANVTATRHVMQAADLSIQMGISRTRVTTQ
jgi:hypothetical protein